MSNPEEPGLVEILRRSRPWWVVPLAVMLSAAVILVLADVVPLRTLAYAVM